MLAKFFVNGSFASLGILFSFSSARAETIQDFLRAFHENPATMMQRLPVAVDTNGNSHPRGFIDEDHVQENIVAKNDLRSELMAKSSSLKTKDYQITAASPSGPDEMDLPERLIDPGTTIVRNLRDIQNRGLMSVSAPILPWSDSYWPKYKGEIGIRYADPGFPNSKIWANNFQYVQSVPASSIVNTGNVSQINNLSPSEKYDFVVGDSGFTLTRYAWKRGEDALKKWGVVSTWEGLCHGWAAAAHLNQPIAETPVVGIHYT